MTIGSSMLGHSYQIEHSPDMSSGSWLPLGEPEDGTGSAIDLSVPIVIAPDRHFYRIRLSLP